MSSTPNGKAGLVFTDACCAIVLVMAVYLAYKMLWWIPLHQGPNPRTALFVLMVAFEVLVMPLAMVMHLRASARATKPLSFLRAIFEEPPARRPEYTSWWWARLAAGAGLVGVMANVALLVW